MKPLTDMAELSAYDIEKGTALLRMEESRLLLLQTNPSIGNQVEEMRAARQACRRAIWRLQQAARHLEAVDAMLSEYPGIDG